MFGKASLKQSPMFGIFVAVTTSEEIDEPPRFAASDRGLFYLSSQKNAYIILTPLNPTLI